MRLCRCYVHEKRFVSLSLPFHEGYRTLCNFGVDKPALNNVVILQGATLSTLIRDFDGKQSVMLSDHVVGKVDPCLQPEEIVRTDGFAKRSFEGIDGEVKKFDIQL
jgi:hypothetical protein